MNKDHGGTFPFVLRRDLGQAGMQHMWLASDLASGKPLLLKEFCLDETSFGETRDAIIESCLKEAEHFAMLQHPNIVSVVEAGIFDGRPIVVMEYVEGTTLERLMTSGNAISVDIALDVITQILDGVGYAHAHGFVHGSLSPSNIFLTTEGEAKVPYYGQVCIYPGHEPILPGIVAGPLGYASPEQVRGSSIDARSNLFSIGVIAYEMLAGFNPFVLEKSDSATILHSTVFASVQDLREVNPSVSPHVAAAIMRSLEKAPELRMPTARDFVSMLEGL